MRRLVSREAPGQLFCWAITALLFALALRYQQSVAPQHRFVLLAVTGLTCLMQTVSAIAALVADQHVRRQLAVVRRRERAARVRTAAQLRALQAAFTPSGLARAAEQLRRQLPPADAAVALARARRLIGLEGPNSAAWLDLARVLVEGGQGDEALRCAAEAVRCGAAEADLLDQLAAALLPAQPPADGAPQAAALVWRCFRPARLDRRQLGAVYRDLAEPHHPLVLRGALARQLFGRLDDPEEAARQRERLAGEAIGAEAPRWLPEVWLGMPISADWYLDRVEVPQPAWLDRLPPSWRTLKGLDPPTSGEPPRLQSFLLPLVQPHAYAALLDQLARSKRPEELVPSLLVWLEEEARLPAAAPAARLLEYHLHGHLAVVAGDPATAWAFWQEALALVPELSGPSRWCALALIAASALRAPDDAGGDGVLADLLHAARTEAEAAHSLLQAAAGAPATGRRERVLDEYRQGRLGDDVHSRFLLAWHDGDAATMAAAVLRCGAPTDDDEDGWLSPLDMATPAGPGRSAVGEPSPSPRDWLPYLFAERCGPGDEPALRQVVAAMLQPGPYGGPADAAVAVALTCAHRLGMLGDRDGWAQAAQLLRHLRDGRGWPSATVEAALTTVATDGSPAWLGSVEKGLLALLRRPVGAADYRFGTTLEDLLWTLAAAHVSAQTANWVERYESEVGRWLRG